MIRRREFISLLGGTVAWPLAARAQQPAVPVIGFLATSSLDATAQVLSGIKLGLAETGFEDPQNVRFEYRWANGQYERLPALAMDLVRQRPTVILTYPAGATLAAKAATTTLPIVFTVGGDPVEQLGLVASYNKPGGNLTGVTAFTGEQAFGDHARDGAFGQGDGCPNESARSRLGACDQRRPGGGATVGVTNLYPERQHRG